MHRLKNEEIAWQVISGCEYKIVLDILLLVVVE
jgi:hypothetical protein